MSDVSGLGRVARYRPARATRWWRHRGSVKSPVQATLVDADGADVGSVVFSGMLSNYRFKSVPDDGWTKGLSFCCYEIRDPQGTCLRRIAGPT